jgi:hypothetical protein
MNIRRPESGPPDPTPQRLRDAAATAPPRADRSVTPEPVAPPLDRVEVTPMAHDLLRRAASERPVVLSLAAERLRQVARRLAQGYYDRPEVRTQVVKRLRDDLDGVGTSD